MKSYYAEYIPNQRLRVSPLRTWVYMLRNIISSKELIYQLFRRDFLMMYKKSFLGRTWLVMAPIIGITSWVFLSAAGILQTGDLGIPMPAYILLSSSIWGLFMGFYQSASGTLGAAQGFINQVKFPHEILLVKQISQQLASFTITFVINILVLLLFGIVPDWRIIFFPILILPMLFLGSAIGLVLSVVNVVATDISGITNTLMGLLFYVTPVIYSADTLAGRQLGLVVELNPLTYLVGGVRDMIIYGRMQYPERFLFVSLISFLAFLLALRLFYVSEEKVVEKMI
jgi:lipopolysaccharide transport system permease protein